MRIAPQRNRTRRMGAIRYPALQPEKRPAIRSTPGCDRGPGRRPSRCAP